MPATETTPTTNRTTLEADFAELLGRANARQQRTLRAAMGFPPSAANIPAATWNAVKQEIEDAAKAALILIYIMAGTSIGEQAADSGIAVDDGRIEADAEAWAGTRAREFADLYVTNTRDAVTEAIIAAETALREGYEPDAVREALDEAMEAVLTPERAEGAAITETTGAITAGEDGAVRQIEETGELVTAYWETERDDKVCPVCLPLDGQPQMVFAAEHPTGPPAHPRCRCGLRWRLVDGTELRGYGIDR